MKTMQLAVTTTKVFQQLTNDSKKKEKREPKTELGRHISQKKKAFMAKKEKSDSKPKDSKSEETTKKAVETVKKVSKVAIKLSVKAIKLVVFVLQMVAMFFTTFGLISCALVCLVVVFLVGAVGYVAVVMNQDSLGKYSNGGVGIGTEQTTPSTPVTADVQKIIDMSDADVWKLISEGKYSSYKEANAAAKANPSAEKAFWTGLLVDVEVPCWKWADSSKTTKQDSTTTIKVNKYVADYFKAYMTDIHSQPEQYVITMVGGFSFRTKNNSSHSGNYSGHSFGATLDINWESDGMGSYSAGYGEKGLPWKTSSGLSDPMKSECCTFDNSWHEVAKKYKLDWGGNWSKSYCDPMHFSLVGDNKKDDRDFSNKYEGRTP